MSLYYFQFRFDLPDCNFFTFVIFFLMLKIFPKININLITVLPSLCVWGAHKYGLKHSFKVITSVLLLGKIYISLQILLPLLLLRL